MAKNKTEKTKTKVVTGNTNLSMNKINKGHSGEESKVKVTGKKC